MANWSDFFKDGFDHYFPAPDSPPRTPLEEVAGLLRVGFTLEPEGITLPWKLPMKELEGLAPTRSLEEFGPRWEGEWDYGPVRSLGGILLPIVAVTDPPIA